MPNNTSEHLKLNELLTSQRLAVLCTQHQGQPYANLVAFSTSEDFKVICFATPRKTRKYDNIKQDGRVSLLVDDRENTAGDFTNAVAATAVGKAIEVEKPRADIFGRYLGKHPELEPFAKSEDSAFFCVNVDSYIFVDNFQHVTEIKP
ncbi:PPOX class probable F420-dependent enzyme [Anaerohalosphaera lusitana]|uniref:PPOX class probable F420-dependent enzyme n=1 Tax=Anaerohalosphaera lusitana TaxID=1936003 RepID=A0A1U9NNN1_9BACT|nr:pyridoxamine 5'-phosphate oxidase family protein [Anaerohalosphaera lusitana]AQT69407.1 PPOX class probable F420-dependent enzyme [Anaerohalosphaera lusitana]